MLILSLTQLLLLVLQSQDVQSIAIPSNGGVKVSNTQHHAQANVAEGAEGCATLSEEIIDSKGIVAYTTDETGSTFKQPQALWLEAVSTDPKVGSKVFPGKDHTSLQNFNDAALQKRSGSEVKACAHALAGSTLLVHIAWRV